MLAWGWLDRYSAVMRPQACESSPTPAALARGNAAIFDRFRHWRARTFPRAFYQIAPRFWTPTGLRETEGMPDSHRRACKTFEPQITGLAYTSRRLYLVVVSRVGSYEHVGKLMHARALLRNDPDYIEHLGKRVSMILLCDSIPPVVEDFARHHHVRILARAAVPEHDTTIAPEPDGSADVPAVDPSDQLRR